MDAVIFPSLLECFSASPLEAMFMNKPLFASNRPFVKQFCGDYAKYFNPNDPYSAAKVIAEYFNDRDKESKNFKLANEYVTNTFNPTTRAESYLKILENMLGRL